jgi:hypothetical protein
VRCLLIVDSFWAGDIEDVSGQLIEVCGRRLQTRRRTFPVPEPEQAGVIDPWVVFVPAGRWAVRTAYRICPLEHPVDLNRESPEASAEGR